MSLSTIQWDDKRKLMSDIIFCPQLYIFCLYLNFAGRFTSFRCVLSARGRAALMLHSTQQWRLPTVAVLNIYILLMITYETYGFYL